MSLENAPIDAPLTDVVERTPSLRRAYVLFVDIVGFGRLRTAQQVAAQTELSQIVLETGEVAHARTDPENFLCRPTGDGMALLFFKDLLSPLRCALQVHMRLQSDAAEIKRKIGAEIKLRMGIHAGEVTLVEDINANTDAAGDGIITAQRVMDLGDADHILLSEEVAKVLKNIEPWAHYLTDLGEVRVKHKTIVHVYNLYGRLDGPFCGNPSKPRAIAEDARNRAKEAREQRPKLSDVLLPYRRPALTMLVLGGMGYGGYSYNQKTGAITDGIKSVQAFVAARTKPAETKPSSGNGKPGKSNKGNTGTKVVKTRNPDEDTPKPGIGDERAQVPNLVHVDYVEAEQMLGGMGLEIKRAGEKHQSGFPDGQVYRQTPGGGAKVARGTRVSVWVSLGPPVAGESDPPGNGDGDSSTSSGNGDGDSDSTKEPSGGASGGE